ncbi:hypothetical protein QEH40_gp03 [Microbacterium phage OscarSo]|uniref:Uncharacterized protein n=1 Tax=Microbacterium phage OscarSo TaxID=2985324 RepID=A0A9X9K2P7_9CAUD|nr:hypothetical protein QEH40_gp03 [Microbacterium phage OscarSo]UYL87124.1 hypothetical protein SEA_OSCARSO_3 [Microbacterium phage OscarSo]
MKLTPDPRPLGFVHPHLGRPIYGEGIIPPRHPIPSRVTGFPLEVTHEAFERSELESIVSIVNEKLRLEDERMRRILPALPAGYSWRGEIQAHDHVDFASLSGSTTIRIVYRLYGPDGERLEISAREAWARAGNGE